MPQQYVRPSLPQCSRWPRNRIADVIDAHGPGASRLGPRDLAHALQRELPQGRFQRQHSGVEGFVRPAFPLLSDYATGAESTLPLQKERRWMD